MTAAKQITDLHKKIDADAQSAGQAFRAVGQAMLRLQLAWHTENMLREVKRRMYRPTSFYPTLTRKKD